MKTRRSPLRLFNLLLAAFVLMPTISAGSEVMVFDQPQVAGISGFREFWDTPVVLAEDGPVVETQHTPGGTGPNAVWSPAKRDGGGKPGAIAFDAVHRSVLVRFPGSAQRIADQLRKGFAVEKAELLLPHRATELWAEGYADPPGMSFLGDSWSNKKPRWHAVAWALRQPWIADPVRGPTFNASVNGTAYWKHFGARDESEDRHPQQLGPTEVSEHSPEGRLDITLLLTDPAFGKTLAARLRAFDGNGLLVRKWETYDLSFWQGGYEWGTATGGRGIIIRAPKLEVTFKPVSSSPRIDSELTMTWPTEKHGKPTAVMPTADQLRDFAEKHGFRRPTWMSDWQWQRVQELKAVGHVQDYPNTLEAYGKWIDEMLAVTPRTWSGFQAAEMTQAYALLGAAQE